MSSKHNSKYNFIWWQQCLNYTGALSFFTKPILLKNVIEHSTSHIHFTLKWDFPSTVYLAEYNIKKMKA